MDSKESVRDSIDRGIKLIAASVVFMYIVVALIAVQSTASLCTFKDDLERRVETSQEFLKENPDGIPGLSRGVIEQGIANQQRTVHSLRFLFFC